MSPEVAAPQEMDLLGFLPGHIAGFRLLDLRRSRWRGFRSLRGQGCAFFPFGLSPFRLWLLRLAPFGLDWLLPRRGGRQAVEYGVPAVRRRKARPAAGAAGVTGPGDGLIVAVGDAGNRAGLLEGHHIPLLVLEGLGDGDLPGASPGAVGFVGYFIIGIGPQILLCILPVGGQGAGAGVQISDDHIVAGTLRHLVEIVEAVHAEAVAQGQNAEGPALAEQGGPRAVRRPDPRRAAAQRSSPASAAARSIFEQSGS